MSETNFDWDDLRLFLAVARGGGLAGATKITGKSAPTLGRRMLRLERRLGEELFIRNARSYDLTEQGQAFLNRVVALENGILPVIEAKAQVAVPIVKVSAGTWVTMVLCENLSEIIDPKETKLRFIASDEVLDIGRREAVVGVRNRRPEDPFLAGRKIGTVQFAVYGRDRGCETWICALGKTPSARWTKQQARASQTIEVTIPRNGLDIAKTGLGRIVLPTFIGDVTQDLVRLSDPIDALEHEQWQVMHHEDRYLPEVRKVIDRMYNVLNAVCAISG